MLHQMNVQPHSDHHKDLFCIRSYMSCMNYVVFTVVLTNAACSAAISMLCCVLLNFNNNGVDMSIGKHRITQATC